MTDKNEKKYEFIKRVIFDDEPKKVSLADLAKNAYFSDGKSTTLWYRKNSHKGILMLITLDRNDKMDTDSDWISLFAVRRVLYAKVNRFRKFLKYDNVSGLCVYGDVLADEHCVNKCPFPKLFEVNPSIDSIVDEILLKITEE